MSSGTTGFANCSGVSRLYNRLQRYCFLRIYVLPIYGELLTKSKIFIQKHLYISKKSSTFVPKMMFYG